MTAALLYAAAPPQTLQSHASVLEKRF